MQKWFRVRRQGDLLRRQAVIALAVNALVVIQNPGHDIFKLNEKRI